VTAVHRLGFVLALVGSAMLSGCGTLPAAVERPTSMARPASADTALARIAARSSADTTSTGFRLMPVGFYALDARIQLMRRATDTIDAQYYLVENDRTGRLFMRSLRDAALRGVRVRLLVDDLYTAGADPMFRSLAAFDNVEVRLFNPFCCSRETITGKYVASLADFGRLNHRMHNKLMVIDGAFAVMGGRNIADEYFTRSTMSNFVDMDVLIAGAVVPKLASLFDAYWNSPQAFPVQAIVQDSTDAATLRRVFDHLVDDGEQMMSVRLPPVDMLGHSPLGDDLDAGRLELLRGRAVAFADQPAKVMATSVEAARAMSVQMDIMDRVMAAKEDVVISSPYFIPGEEGVREFAELRQRHVQVSVLTNSLAATDEPLVHVGYSRYRMALMHTGIDLYELSPTRIVANDRSAGAGKSLGRLHAKAAVIDRTTVYLGSMNLDPRSDSTNTEIGLIVECPALALQVERALDMSKARGSYRLRFAPGGDSLEWIATDERGEAVFSSEPEVTPWSRIRNMLLGPFVPEQLL
jgi:putative cardiolipin synthase